MLLLGDPLLLWLSFAGLLLAALRMQRLILPALLLANMTVQRRDEADVGYAIDLACTQAATL